jgi:hypothetical protein
MINPQRTPKNVPAKRKMLRKAAKWGGGIGTPSRQRKVTTVGA